MKIYIDSALDAVALEARIRALVSDWDAEIYVVDAADCPRGLLRLWFLPEDKVSKAGIQDSDPVIVVPVQNTRSQPLGSIESYTTERWCHEGYKYEHAAILRRGVRMLAERQQRISSAAALTLKTAHLRALYDVSAKLSSEPHLETLLELIVTTGREITHADAGSLYLIEHPDKDADNAGQPAEEAQGSQLAFLVAQNDSLDVPFKAFRMPLSDASVAGFVALSGQTVIHDDVYELDSSLPYSFNKSFDQSVGYRTKSMMVVPMKTHEGDIIGVLQLINKRARSVSAFTKQKTADEFAIPFGPEDIEMCQALGSQAALAVENARLYGAIQNLLESFMRASVKAIEARDPTTSGHSERVADYSVALAECVDKVSAGTLRHVSFSKKDLDQIYFAGILHDFGKIGVREDVLVKAKKLYPEQMRGIEDRFAYLRRTVELRRAQKMLALYQSGKATDAKMKSIERETQSALNQLDHAYQVIVESNEPALLHTDAAQSLNELRHTTFTDIDGSAVPLLLDDEFLNLSVGRGSLNDRERLEIESHVQHTYDFLRMIPWTKELQSVPEIAYGHHEKLDGTGYPRQLTAASIPVPVRMMTVSDIFDALTAQDRPYKRAVPTERALNILHMEVDEGKLDKDIVQIFVEAKVYETVLGQAR